MMVHFGRSIPRVAGRPIERSARLAFLSLVAALCTLWALAGDPGRIEGALTVNGEATALTHVYAHQRPGHFDSNRLDAVVILCDRELSGDAVMDPNERLKLEKAGNLRALELTVSPEGKLTNVKIRHPAFEWGPSGNSTRYKLTFDRYDETGLAGRITCNGERKEKGVGFTFSAEFAVDYPAR